jgi:uncharacterized protein YkwD
MNCLPTTTLAAALLLAGWPAAAQSPAGPGRAPQELMDLLSAARVRGCVGHPAGVGELRWVPQLGEAARLIARGLPAREATEQAGYRSVRLYQVSMSGHRSLAAVARDLVDKHCEALTDPALTDAGLHRQGTSAWIVLAQPFSPPPPSAAAAVAARVLALANEARSRPRSCGKESFQAAPPLRPNAALEGAAAAHARDMAARGALEHQGRDGSSAADRVERAGYRWRSVGENIASGQLTPDQVVRDWVRSPVHCANLMSPRFTEMGVAYAVDLKSPDGIYWAQALARPR